MQIATITNAAGELFTRNISKGFCTRALEKTNLKPIRDMAGKVGDTFVRQTSDVKIKIEEVKRKLDEVLTSEHCEMPDYMSLIPKDATEEVQLEELEKLYRASKFFSRVDYNEQRFGKDFEFALKSLEESNNATRLISDETSDDFWNVFNTISTHYSETNAAKHGFDAGKNPLYRGFVPKYKGDTYKIPWIWKPVMRADMRVLYYDKNGQSYKKYSDIIANIEDIYATRVTSYPKFKLTKVRKDLKYLEYPYPDEVAQNMATIKLKYEEFLSFVKQYQLEKRLTPEMIAKAENRIAEIYYLMANTCPLNRGSNGTTDVLMRSLYSSIGIEKPPVKEGIGLDWEAFTRTLDDYKANWNSFFE